MKAARAICLLCFFFHLSLQAEDIKIKKSTITVVYAPEQKAPLRALIHEWIERSANAVASYLDNFPVSTLKIKFVQLPNSDQIHGATYGGAVIRMRLGEKVTRDNLKNDWVMVHELMHVAFPDLDERYLWMEEGLSTYIEPVIRAQAKIISEAQIWEEMKAGLPKGQPTADDPGLDGTKQWGRIYWGGAMYWFLVDLEVRERTKNKKTIADVLKYINQHDGNGMHDWPLESVFKAAKEATGLDTMKELHTRLGLHAEKIDIDGLWKRVAEIEKTRKMVE